MKAPASMLEARIVREIHRALKLHGAPPALQAEARKRTHADHQFLSRAYETLERLGANRWLLVILGSWRDSASDEMTYESLKAINEGRFAVNITATEA
jgi:hypothetical protein